MKILGSSITKVSAERRNAIKGKLNVKSNIDIEDITTEDVAFSKNDGIRFNFKFSIDYDPDIANVEIKGSVLVLDDENESKALIKDWKKKKFDHPIKVPLFNYIMDKANLRALQLEEELALPLHIQFPKLRATPAEEKK